MSEDHDSDIKFKYLYGTFKILLNIHVKNNDPSNFDNNAINYHPMQYIFMKKTVRTIFQLVRCITTFTHHSVIHT